MKSEKQVREHLEVLRTLKTVVHPSLITFGEWVLDEGNKEDQEWLFKTLSQIASNVGIKKK